MELDAPGWIRLATLKLAPQVRGAVQARYHSDLQAAVDRGESPAQVLARWGHPWTASAALQRTHLTVYDARLLHPGYPRGEAGLRALLAEWWWLPPAALALATLLPLGLGPALVAAVLAVLALRWAALSGERSAAGRARAAHALCPLRLLAYTFVPAWLLSQPVLPGVLGAVGPGVVLLAFAAAAVSHELRRSRRLREALNKLPPEGSA